MSLKKVLILLFLTFCIISCVYLHDKDKYENFINVETNSEISLKTNGYYYYEFMSDYHGFGKNIRQFYSLFLYKDGTLQFGWSCRETKSTLYQDQEKFSLEMRHEYFSNRIKEKQDILSKSPRDWGHCKISKDSIHIKFYSTGPVYPDSYRLYELDGHIINDSTFVIT